MLWKIKDEAHFNLSPTDGVMYYWLFDVNEVPLQFSTQKA